MNAPKIITDEVVLEELSKLTRATTTTLARLLGYQQPRRNHHDKTWTAALIKIRKVMLAGVKQGTIRAYGEPVVGEGQRWEMLTSEVQERLRDHHQRRGQAQLLLRTLGELLSDPDIEDSNVRLFDPRPDDPAPPEAETYVDLTISIAQLRRLVQAIENDGDTRRKQRMEQALPRTKVCDLPVDVRRKVQAIRLAILPSERTAVMLDFEPCCSEHREEAIRAERGEWTP